MPGTLKITYVSRCYLHDYYVSKVSVKELRTSKQIKRNAMGAQKLQNGAPGMVVVSRRESKNICVDLTKINANDRQDQHNYMLSRESTLAQLVTYLGTSSVICISCIYYILISCLSVILGVVSLHMQGYSVQLKIRFVITIVVASLWQTTWFLSLRDSFSDNGTSWILTVIHSHTIYN